MKLYRDIAAALLYIVCFTAFGSDPGNGITISLNNAPLKTALEIYNSMGGETISVKSDVPKYHLSLATVEPIDKLQYYRILRQWSELRGLKLTENALTIAEEGIPDYSKQAAESAKKRLKNTLARLSSTEPNCSLDFDGMPLNIVLKVLSDLSGKIVINGILPEETLTLKVEEVTAAEAILSLDRALNDKGIVLMESEPSLIIAASIKPMKPDLNTTLNEMPSRVTARRIVIPFKFNTTEERFKSLIPEDLSQTTSEELSHFGFGNGDRIEWWDFRKDAPNWIYYFREHGHNDRVSGSNFAAEWELMAFDPETRNTYYHFMGID